MFCNTVIKRTMANKHHFFEPKHTVPMSIQGRLARERERLLGMTDEERAWRKKWIQDQVLAPNEPRVVPEIYYELNNPIRRFYQAPLRFLFKFTVPILGEQYAENARNLAGKILMTLFGAVVGVYWLKYNRSDWERIRGFRVYSSKVAVLPGEEGYPKTNQRTKPSDYNNKGFKDANI